MKRLGLGVTELAGWLMLGALAHACGGDTSQPRTSGESHFLDYCEESCGSGLDCISGVCTRSCLIEENACGDLSAQAKCTDQSIEPGRVAVCDVECDSDAECRHLGPDHACDAGFCRSGEPAVPGTGGTSSGGSGGAGGSNASTGGTTTGGSVSAGAPTGGTSGGSTSICYPAYELLDLTGGEQERTCRTCACDGSDADCTDIDCDAGIPIYPCAPDRPPEQGEYSLDIEHYSIDGDILTVTVGHGGGCEQHKTGLCFGSFLEPAIVVTGLEFEHQFVGDTICDAHIERTLKYDLSALGDAYLDAYGGDGGLVDTNLGMYGFGELTCEERVTLSNDRITTALEQLDNSCETDDDCVSVNTDTECHRACGMTTSKASQAELEAAVAEIDAGVCTAYTEAGCPPAFAPPCIAPMPYCDNGTCR